MDGLVDRRTENGWALAIIFKFGKFTRVHIFQIELEFM